MIAGSRHVTDSRGELSPLSQRLLFHSVNLSVANSRGMQIAKHADEDVCLNAVQRYVVTNWEMSTAQG